MKEKGIHSIENYFKLFDSKGKNIFTDDIVSHTN